MSYNSLFLMASCSLFPPDPHPDIGCLLPFSALHAARTRLQTGQRSVLNSPGIGIREEKLTMIGGEQVQANQSRKRIKVCLERA
jgi:hypothetical protein